MTAFAQTDALRLLDRGKRYDPDTFADHFSGGAFRSFAWQKHIGRVVGDAVRAGGGRIIINVPPRHGKSEYFSRWLPIWFLDNWPDRSVILVSYGAELAEHFGRVVRNEFEQNEWLATQLREDSQAVNRWHTPEGGGMIATGIGGPLLGFGAHLVVIDDPHKSYEEAQSPLKREAVTGWFGGTLYSRLEPGATIVVIQQRLHEDDLSGYLIGQHTDAWKVYRLPALAEPGDPMGRAEGEPLCPERYSATDLEGIKLATPATRWQPMYQQNPELHGTGRVYHAYLPADHDDKTLRLRDDLPLHVSFDFNVNPGMHVVLGQYDSKADLFTAVHEIHGPRMKLAASLDALEKYVKDAGGFRWPKLQVFGDATGSAERAETTESAYAMIRRRLTETGWPFQVLVPAANPPIRERVETFNDALRDSSGEVHYKVNPLACPRLVADLKYLKEGDDGLPDKRDTALSHSCLAAGTMVETEYGPMPIEVVPAGMMVLTRSGFSRVSRAWMASPEAQVYSVRTIDGRTVIATANHPFWVRNRGFTLVSVLKKGDALDIMRYPSASEANCEKNQSDTAENCGSVTRTPSACLTGCTLDVAGFGSTFRSIGIITDQSRRAGTSTTRTRTQRTMTPEISRRCRGATTSAFMLVNQSTWPKAWRRFQRLVWPRLRGTPPTRGEGGTSGKLARRDSATTRLPRTACSAESGMSISRGGSTTAIALEAANPLLVEPRALTMNSGSVPFAERFSSSTDTTRASAAPVLVESVSPYGRQPVYDLTVEDAHEFYANGILVSNSDAEGYRAKRLRPIHRLKFTASIVAFAKG